MEWDDFSNFNATQGEILKRKSHLKEFKVNNYSEIDNVFLLRHHNHNKSALSVKHLTHSDLLNLSQVEGQTTLSESLNCNKVIAHKAS